MKKMLIALVLTGCASAEPERTPQERLQAYRDAIQYRCASYGFREGTDSFSQCVMQLDMYVRRAVAAQAADRAGAFDSYSRSLQGTQCTIYGDTMRCY